MNLLRIILFPLIPVYAVIVKLRNLFFDKNILKEEIGIRYGYALFPDDGDTFDALLKKATPKVEVLVGGQG